MQARISGSESDRLIELVDCAYHAAFDESSWPAFLERFADALRGHNTALLVQDLSSHQNRAVACVRTDPEQLRLYNEYYCGLNPWIINARADLAAGRDGVGVGEMHCENEELVRTDFYNGWLRPQKLKHSIAALIARSGNRAVLCSTLRSGSAGPFSAKDIVFFEALLPHLRRAMLTRERAGKVFVAGRQALELLENSPSACLLADRAARMVFVNRAAREILGKNSGVSLRTGVLVASRHEDTRRLQMLIARAVTTPPSGGEMAILRERGQPLLIAVSPIQPHYESSVPSPAVVAIWISDPNRDAMSRAKRIRTLFGLTLAESSVAAELAQGLSLDEISEALGISRHTVRNHLKKIFEKTGVHRQAEIVRMVLSCPDPFGS
jgi:DNA-binding CsgD family transcriptional regulator